MLVKCPGCYTTYRVGDNLIGTSKPTFRCSRCKLIFALDLKSKVEEEPREAGIQTTLGKKGEEPSLPFPSSTSATAKDDGGEPLPSMAQTDADSSTSESDRVEIQTSLKEDPLGQTADPFKPEEKPSFQSDNPPSEGDDSIAEIQRFLAESQEPPPQGQDTLNAGTDFTTGSKESTEQKEGSFFSSQDWAETTSESPTAKKDEPLSATEFFAQSEQSPPQEQDPLAGSQDTVAESQESIYNPAENTVTPAEESAPSATEDADPFDFEREASHLGEETPLTGVETKKADEQISTKPKVREYKGKTFGVKKKIPSSDSEADSAPQTYVERRKPPIAAQESHAGGPVSIIPYISLFGILLLTFSLLTLIYQAQPAKVEAYLKSIPWFGSILFKNSHLRQGVVLESLNSGFRKIYGGRQVFVITGKILNRNQVSVRDVRLEGLIHTGAGKELGRQTISVGNPISSKIISDMTVREIAILQRLKPQKRFEIAPDGSAAFTIVFLRPSKDIKSFSCRVLTTKGTV